MLKRRRKTICLIAIVILLSIGAFFALPKSVTSTSEERANGPLAKSSPNRLSASSPLSQQSDKRGKPKGTISMDRYNRIRDGLRCTRLNPRLLLFPRVPKCASTSISTLLFLVSKKYRYAFIENTNGAHAWTPNDVKEATDKIAKTLAQNNSRAAYARHFYYNDFRALGVAYSYITFIRDPVERFISSYLYYHKSDLKHIKALRWREKIDSNENVAECLKHKRGGCETNLITRYFCGSETFCASGSALALDHALMHLLRRFAVVGLVDDLTTSIRLLGHVLPRFFPREVKLPDSVMHRNANKKSEKDKMALLDDEETVKLIRKANWADVVLYDFAKKLFYRRIKMCGIG